MDLMGMLAENNGSELGRFSSISRLRSCLHLLPIPAGANETAVFYAVFECSAKSPKAFEKLLLPCAMWSASFGGLFLMRVFLPKSVPGMGRIFYPPERGWIAFGRGDGAGIRSRQIEKQCLLRAGTETDRPSFQMPAVFRLRLSLAFLRALPVAVPFDVFILVPAIVPAVR